VVLGCGGLVLGCWVVLLVWVFGWGWFVVFGVFFVCWVVVFLCGVVGLLCFVFVFVWFVGFVVGLFFVVVLLV
ncbi:hypothetical protein ACTHUE_20475, partial [Neisseria sp. P0021.S005]|uniref:hypothetical protein n=1 Tax=Neisseria sp. P0021.S005 TaxID=3436820 RepID=UPI003F80BBD7